jgi:mono/diheme cytochrome c family protein
MGSSLRIGLARPRLTALAGGLVAAVVVGAFYVSGAVANQPQPSGAAHGATVFVNNCQVCHGVNAQGRIGPPLLPLPERIASEPRPVVTQELTGLVRDGIPGAMPRFVPEQLSDADVAALVDWFFEANANVPQGRNFYEALAPVGAVENTGDRTFFDATGHTLTGGFKRYWEANGGLAQFGYPLTEEYVGFSETDGKPYTMQLFERARFEYHPEHQGTPNEVQQGLLGSESKDLRMHFLTGMGDGGP